MSFLFHIVGSGTTPSSDETDNYNGDTCWVTTSELREGLISGTEKSVTAIALARYPALRVFPVGTLLIAMYGATVGRLGTLAVEAATNQACCAFAQPNGIEIRFAFYALWAARNYLILSASGGGQPNINQEKLRALRIAVPPIVEQTAIAAFLDRETAKIDALVAEQEKLIALLKEKRQAVISHAVTKGLDPDAPMKPSGIEWLGDVPAHWEIGALTRFIGPVIDYRGRTPEKVDDGMFLVTAKNIRNGRIDYGASEEYVTPESARPLLARGTPELGDVLFTTEAPLGQVALVDRTDVALAQRIVKFRGRRGVLLSQYLLFWLMSSYCQALLETLATGSTAQGIKASKFSLIQCVVPPVVEQKTLVEILTRRLQAIDSLSVEIERAITLLKERRTALISAAVTGKIDVRGLVPAAPQKVDDHRLPA